MHEKEKIAEANYFYSRMLNEVDSNENFTYDLSAFLTSARSVLQYALEEAKTKPNGKQWYDNYVSKNSVLSFFKDKRDLNIHIRPVKPVEHVQVGLVEKITATESVTIVKTGPDGKVITETYGDKGKLSKPQSDPPIQIRKEYKFTDWNGTENVIDLANRYLIELQKLVDEGNKRGYLT